MRAARNYLLSAAPSVFLRFVGHRLRRFLFGPLLLLVGLKLTTGCGFALPSPEEFLNGLNFLILEPNVSCAQLRAGFGLTDRYPLAETPRGVGLEYEEHFVHAGDGVHLRVWYLPTKLDRGAVIVSQGTAGTMPCYLFTGKLLADSGWTVVMYEYHGYGSSGGSPSMLTLRGDLETVLDWTLARTGRSQVSLLGISLGTLPSIALGAKRPEAVNALVLDSPVAISRELSRLSFLFGGREQGYLPYLGEDLNSEALIQEVFQPKLMLLHDEDIVTPPATIEHLFELAPEPKELVRFPYLPHAFGQYYMTDLFAYHVDTFLSSVWTKQPAAPAIAR